MPHARLTAFVQSNYDAQRLTYYRALTANDPDCQDRITAKRKSGSTIWVDRKTIITVLPDQTIRFDQHPFRLEGSDGRYLTYRCGLPQCSSPSCAIDHTIRISDYQLEAIIDAANRSRKRL